jgi:LPXTG-site transpeptidase (sortase) family protein
MKRYQYFIVFALFITSLIFPSKSVRADITFDIGVNEEFLQPNIAAGGTSTLRIYLYNTNAFQIVLGSSPAAFTYTLPTNLNFTDPINISNTCGGLITSSGTTFSLLGGTIPAMMNGTQGTCSISVQVTTTRANTYYSHIDANIINATDPGGNPATNSKGSAEVSLTVSSVQPPSLSKTFSPNTIWTGQTSTMSLRLTNTDQNYSLTKVSVTDSLPSGLTLSSTSFTSTNCGSPTVSAIDGSSLTVGAANLKVINATIAKNSTCVVNFTVSATTPGIYINSIPAGAIQTQQGVTNSSAASAPLNVQNITINKSFSPSTVMVGGESTMTVTLKNPTGSDYTDVSFTDTLPSGMTVVAGSMATTCNKGAVNGVVTTNASSGTVVLSGGVVTAGTTCSVTAKVTIAVAGSYTNTLPAGSLTIGTTGITNVLAATANLSSYGNGQGLSGSKSFSPKNIAVGGTSRLTISLRAPSDVTALTNVTLVDALPSGVEVASTPSVTASNCGSPTFSPQAGDTSLSFSGGTIQSGATCSFSVMVTAANTGSFTNVISSTNISNDEGRNITGTLQDTLTVSGISVTKAFFPSAVSQGNISTLTIQLTNDNTDQLNNVSFTDNLPTGLSVADDGVTRSYVNTCGGAVTAALNATSIMLTGGSIPAKVGSVAGTCTINIDVLANKTGTLTNTIAAKTVTGTLKTSGISISNPNSATASLQVVDLSITINKSFSPVSVTGGGTSTMSVYLSNPNNYALSGITFKDSLPQSGTGTSGMHVAAAPNFTAGTCGGSVLVASDRNSFTYSGGSLAANTNCTLTIDVVMDYDGNMTNTIASGDVTTTNGATNPLAGTATLYNSPGAYIVKTFYNIDSNGHTADMKVVITNDYSYKITGIRFTDPFPTGMTLVSAAASQCNGTVTTTANSLTITGGSLNAGESCEVDASIQTTSAGSFENCIADGAMEIDQKDSSGNVITNHGKACDTLVTTDEVNPPVVTKSFSPASIPLGSSAEMDILINNPNTIALTDVTFNDTLPAGMTLTSIPNATQCNGGTVAWDSSSGVLSLSGGSLSAKSNCTVVASVTGASALVYENSVDVTANGAGESLTSNTSTASLTVVAPPEISKSFSPDAIIANAISTLTFQIQNPSDNSTSLTGVGFVDPLPTGVKVASVPNVSISSDCGAATFNPAAGVTKLTMSGASIAVGATCTVSVDVTAANGGTFENTTEAVTSTNGGTGNTAKDTLTVSGPGLTLEKSTTTANYKAKDDKIEYSYLLTNTGDTNLNADFQVFDDHINSGAAIDCNNGNPSLVLAPGDSTTCTAEYTVTDTDMTAKSITNKAYATAKDETDTTVTSNTDSVTVKEARLTVVKTTSSVSYFKTGTKLNYSYMLTNTGSVPLFAPFTVTDDHINSGTPFACGSVTQLDPGGNVSCTSSYSTVNGDMDAAVTGVTNNAYAEAVDKDGLDVRSNTATVTVPKLDTPAITKSFSPAVVAVSQTSTLTITINNPTWSDTNMVPLTGVGFSDVFPSGLNMVNTPDANQCGGTVAWNSSTKTLSFTGGTVIGTSCNITALVSSDAANVYTNTTGNVSASNSATSTEPVEQRSATLTVVQGAAISKSFSPDTILQGEKSTLTLVLTNPSSNTQTLEGVAFSDTFPAGLTVYSSPAATMVNCGSDAAFAPVAGASSFSFTGGEIPVGQSCTLTVDVVAPAVGQYLNTTSATTSTNGGTGATSNTAALTVKKTADLQITKTDGVAAVNRNEALTYTVVVTNAGPSDVSGASVVDNIPSNLTGATWTCVGAGGATCTASGSGNIADTIDLPINGTSTYTITAAISSSAVSSVANIAVVTPPSDVSDSNPLNNIASDVDAYNSLSIVKSADPTTYSVIGTNIEYTYTITNSGTSTLSKPFHVYDDKLTPTCSSIPDTLIPGASFSCTGKHELTNDDLDAASITNNAYATGTDADGDTITSNTDTVTVTSDQTPLIGLAKEAVKVKLVSTGTYDVSYLFTLTNYGNVTLHNLQVTDNLVTAFPSAGVYNFTVQLITSSSLSVNAGFDGDSEQNLLMAGNTLSAGETKTVELLVRVVPLSHGPFYNTATVTSLDPKGGSANDVSQNDTNPDANGDGNPTNDFVPTPVDFGSQIFKPLTGSKSLNSSEMPMMHWSMTWMNNQNIVPLHAVIYDPIPENTEYVLGTSDSKIALPSDAPTGSTSQGVTCKVIGKSSTQYCYYEGPTADYPLGRVVWVGSLAPDYGVNDLSLAANSVQIVFSTKSVGNPPKITNTAESNSDLNGDGDYNDTGEMKNASAVAEWVYSPEKLPVSGFAPGIKTQLPSQPLALNYASMGDLWLEIPGLKISTSIIGVPQTDGNWDISWLGGDTGWLYGTAYPTHNGNSVLTAHLVDSNGNPGPFANIDQLKYGDRFIIHAWNQQFIYEVRETKIIESDDTKDVFKHEDTPWITLLTCRNYDAKTGTYLHHYLVRAVLIQVK